MDDKDKDIKMNVGDFELPVTKSIKKIHLKVTEMNKYPTLKNALMNFLNLYNKTKDITDIINMEPDDKILYEDLLKNLNNIKHIIETKLTDDGVLEKLTPRDIAELSSYLLKALTDIDKAYIYLKIKYVYR